MSDPTPIEPIDPSAQTAAEENSERRKRPLLLIIFLALTALLLATVIVLAIALSQRSEPRSSAEAPPMSTPTSTPKAGHPTGDPSPPPTSTSPSTPPAAPAPAPPPPPPAPTKTTIDSFTVTPSVIYCNTASPVPFERYIAFSWSTSNVNTVGFGIATDDALAAGMGWNLPPSGKSDTDFPLGYTEFTFPCPQESQSYTLTVEGPSGRVSHKVTVTNAGDK